MLIQSLRTGLVSSILFGKSPVPWHAYGCHHYSTNCDFTIAQVCRQKWQPVVVAIFGLPLSHCQSKHTACLLYTLYISQHLMVQVTLKEWQVYQIEGYVGVCLRWKVVTFSVLLCKTLAILLFLAAVLNRASQFCRLYNCVPFRYFQFILKFEIAEYEKTVKLSNTITCLTSIFFTYWLKFYKHY